MATDDEREFSHETDIPDPAEETDDPGRLVDDILAYLRTRQTREDAVDREVDEERLLRTVIHRLRQNPIPTAMLGISAAWLLLADENDDEVETVETGFGEHVEEEILAQLQGGLTYTNARLRELVDRYPWAAATAIVGGGLLAAFLLPKRRRGPESSYVEPETEIEPDAFEDDELR